MQPTKYAVANLKWNTTAYYDQQRKVLVIYDQADTLRCVIAGGKFISTVLLLGDSEYYQILLPIELGSASKNSDAMSKTYSALCNDPMVPSFDPKCDANERISLYEIFIQTQAGMCRRGGFKAIKDADEWPKIEKKINDAIKIYRHYRVA